MDKKTTVIITLCVMLTLVCFLSIFLYKKNQQLDQIHANINQLYMLDAEYKASYENSISNADKVTLNYKLADKWEKLSDYYYGELLMNANSDLIEELEHSKETWENNKSRYCRALETYTHNEFSSGTIVPLILSKHLYDMNRFRAIELCSMLLQG